MPFQDRFKSSQLTVGGFGRRGGIRNTEHSNDLETSGVLVIVRVDLHEAHVHTGNTSDGCVVTFEHNWIINDPTYA